MPSLNKILINNEEYDFQASNLATVASSGDYNDLTNKPTAASLGAATTAQLEELKTSVSEGKALIAAAVTGKGVQTAGSDSFSTIANNINSISFTPTITVTTEEIDISSYVGKSAVEITLSKSGYELHKNLFIEVSYFGHYVSSINLSGNEYRKYGNVTYSLAGSILTIDLSSFEQALRYGYQSYYTSVISNLKIIIYYLDIN